MVVDALLGPLNKAQWGDFMQYEDLINDRMTGKRVLGLCTYPLAHCSALEVFEIARSHEAAYLRRGGSWEVIEYRKP